jgi:peptidoglycan/xylan/chitin deacetylase (PgdA/CDA1 family)
VTLTHDVDTGWILDDRRSALLREILDAESSLGFRGAWYVTAQQLSTRRHGKALESLLDAGCELGAHGWNHDARLNYLSAERQEGRMRRIAARFAGRAVAGMRTPWYCRSEQLHRVLGRHFQYDSSVPNASGFFSSETNSGCCSFLPYRTRSGIMELPMTLPPDTAIDGKAGYDELLRCADPILALGGVVVVTMHPQPHQSGSPAALRRYLHFLEQLAERCSDRAWRATPREIVRHYEDALLDRGLVGGTR